jgi:hypothetical protein
MILTEHNEQDGKHVRLIDGLQSKFIVFFFWQHVDPAVTYTLQIIKSRIIASASSTCFFFELFGIYEAPTQTIDGRHEGYNRWVSGK